MRAYTVDAAAFALDVSLKWLDNILSHHDVPGIAHGRQGIQRRIPVDSLLVIALARTVHQQLGTPLRRALQLAELVINAADGDIVVGSADTLPGQVRLSVDVTAMRNALESRLREGVEFGAAPRRGRPPKPRS